MGKYGFSDDVEPAAPQLISLPKPKPKADKPAPALVADAVRAGESLGFVSREPRKKAEAPARRPGRQRTEPQAKLLVTGPERVIDAFRAYCEREDIASYWQAIERLLESNSLSKR